MKKFYLIALILLGSIGVSKSQDASKSESNENWILLTVNQGVNIYYQMSPTCATEKSLFLRFENTSDVNVTVNWVLPDFVIQNPIEKQNTSSISVSAHQNVNGECSSTAPLQLFWRFKEEKHIPESTIFQIVKN